MGYRLTKAAERDIGSIAQTGIELFGARQARSYHEALSDLFALLATSPRMGRERSELIPPARVHPFRSHIVIYRIEGENILIIRVRHGREDWRQPSED